MTNTDVAIQSQQVPQRHSDNRPPAVILRERFQDRRGELKNQLPSDISPDEFIRAAMTSTALNPDILACSWNSIWNSCLRSCRDGLLPDGVDAALVPFKGTCSYIPMYQGLLRRFRRSGNFKWIKADIVREGDEFIHYVDENGEHFRHVPGDDSDRPMTKAYALATTKDGGVFVTVMTSKEIAKRRAISKATRDDSPWKMWPDEMVKKTMLRSLSKVLPSARDIVSESEELPDIEGPSSAPQMLNAPRGNGPSATLDQFANQQPASLAGGTAPAASDDVGGEGGEQGSKGGASESAAREATADPAAADETTEHLKLVEAFKRGQKAKAEGHQRKAIPPEYRAADQTRAALCWQAGYDGGTMPDFNP